MTNNFLIEVAILKFNWYSTIENSEYSELTISDLQLEKILFRINVLHKWFSYFFLILPNWKILLKNCFLLSSGTLMLRKYLERTCIAGKQVNCMFSRKRSKQTHMFLETSF